MKPQIWRIFALAAIFVALCFALFFRGFEIPRTDFGFTVRTNGVHRIVTTLDPKGPAFAAHVRLGDILEPTKRTLDTALTYTNPHPGDSLDFNLTQDGRSRPIMLRASTVNFAEFPIAITIERLALLLFAALLAWRRPDDAATRKLVVFLASFGFALALNNAELPNRLATLLILQYGSIIAFAFGTAALVGFAAEFPTKENGGLRTRIASAATIIATLMSLIFLGSSTGTIFSNERTEWATALIGGGEVLLVIGAIVNFFESYRHSQGLQRQRQLWVMLTFALGLCGPLLAFAAVGLDRFTPFIDSISVLTIPIIPVGLAYVMLRHRVLDIGFVINRAVVFAAVSLFLVAVLAIVEFVLGKYVDHFSRAASVYIQLGVAIGLGFSLRFVHTRIDRVVDDIFFRARHEAEAAIRRFAHEAPFVTEISVLVNRTVRVVRANTSASAAILYVQKGGGLFKVMAATDGTHPDVDENDCAVLAMRTWHQPLELDRMESALRGDLAFPMMVRGELIGFLVCGTKLGSQTYAPDEREALASLAHSVGVSLSALSIAALKTEVARLTDNGVFDSSTLRRLKGLATGGAETAFQLMVQKTPEEIVDQS